ncbi:hypothetical protein [Pseudonocardia sp. GCM10023141]|uniref:hypothetical protein n=1 Tax=Pseudonocardia sp. GCM10023141 TaxID=3252653 RepID=UPI0036182F65
MVDTATVGPRQRGVTVVRVLILITGFTSVVNGLLEQNPESETSTRVFGWFLVVLGLVCWWLVWRLRRPGGRVLLLVLLGVLVAVRIYQMIRFATFLPATGLILPVLVFLRMRSGPVRAWLDPLTVRGTAMRIPAPPRTGLARLGAVGITAVLLFVISAAATAVALWP